MIETAFLDECSPKPIAENGCGIKRAVDRLSEGRATASVLRGCVRGVCLGGLPSTRNESSVLVQERRRKCTVRARRTAEMCKHTMLPALQHGAARPGRQAKPAQDWLDAAARRAHAQFWREQIARVVRGVVRLAESATRGSHAARLLGAPPPSRHPCPRGARPSLCVPSHGNAECIDARAQRDDDVLLHRDRKRRIAFGRIL
jgi:hypothetical protein